MGLEAELLPMDGESQMDFAVRWHESMMDSIPNTDERNRLCFETYRRHAGDEPEVHYARQAHPPEEYDERRDIACFAEHETPSRKLQNGTIIPGEKYSRSELIEIGRNMNSRIADIGSFCPLSDGHTGDDPKHPQPQVLGYTGAYRLGMSGNENPKWTLFCDEYHRKDCSNALRTKRGRSVEVWKYKRMRDRFFHPIAVLGAEAPRLDIPPAKYSRDNANTEVVVERYMMVAPGGNGTGLPTDQYGFGGAASPTDQLAANPTGQLIQDLLSALFESSLGQFMLNKMAEEGASGTPTPAVTQPPQLPSAPGASGIPGMGGDPMGGAGLPPGMDMGAAMGGDPMGGGAPPQGAAPQESSDSPFGGEQKGDDDMGDSNEKYSREILQRLESIEKENKTLREQLSNEVLLRKKAERYNRLSELSNEVLLNVEKELGRVESMTDEQFAGHCESIRENYQRRPDQVDDLVSMTGAGRRNESIGAELDENQSREVARYAMRNHVSYEEAREKYLSENKRIAG